MDILKETPGFNIWKCITVAISIPFAGMLLLTLMTINADKKQPSPSITREQDIKKALYIKPYIKPPNPKKKKTTYV
ncbi:MAG: hypothetical protein GY774_16445 [Planctomycetes bacterium]|nr:hypothetical protein [Planctomycetota bacterium]